MQIKDDSFELVSAHAMSVDGHHAPRPVCQALVALRGDANVRASLVWKAELDESIDWAIYWLTDTALIFVVASRTGVRQWNGHHEDSPGYAYELVTAEKRSLSDIQRLTIAGTRSLPKEYNPGWRWTTAGLVHFEGGIEWAIGREDAAITDLEWNQADAFWEQLTNRWPSG